MEAEKIDRRKLRTRRMLRDALLELILERGYDSITIQDITERADLRRATFYLHYSEKHDLLLATLAETFDSLVSELEPVTQGKVFGGKTAIQPYLVVVQHVEKHADLYCAILESSAAALVNRHLRDYLAGHMLNALGTLPKESIKTPPEILAYFVAGAELTLVAWWLEHDKPYSAETMAEMIRDTILTGIKGGLVDNALDDLS